jgi:hypothetical protein
MRLAYKKEVTDTYMNLVRQLGRFRGRADDSTEKHFKETGFEDVN